MKRFNLALFIDMESIESPEHWKHISKYLTNSLRVKRKEGPISIHLASTTTINTTPRNVLRYCADANIKHHVYVELNDPDNYLRSECLATTCDAAILVFPLTPTLKANSELNTAATSFTNAGKTVRYIDLQKIFSEDNEEQTE